jgi:translation initiation factor IF-3
MMASDDKKTKTEPVQKSEAPAKGPKNEAPAKEAPAKEAPAKEASAKKESTSGAEPSKAEPSKPEGGEAGAEKPSNYSRGEGQKPVSKAYKDNWNAIFAKKNNNKKTKTKKR